MPAPGSFCLVLHTHLPYVLGHSTWPHGAKMLYDAAADCYLPLLRVFQRLANDGIPPRVTVSLTPVVLEQLADERFKEWFPPFLSARAESAEANRIDFKGRGELHLTYLAEWWAKHFRGLLRYFEDDLKGDIPAALRELQEAGQLELMSAGPALPI